MDAAKKKKLKSDAHHLNPVVMIGNAGLTAAVIAEIELALDVHELIKVKIRAERYERKEICAEIIAATTADLIQGIGQIIVIYRHNPKK